MKIQTATNEAACEGKNEEINEGYASNPDIDLNVQEFEQTLHIVKIKERQYFEKWYGFTSYILFFFTFSIMGWIWEVGLHVVQTGDFVKRGVLYGPWLPIYGTGGVLVLLLLRKTFRSPIITFFLTMVISSVMEYFTSWVLETNTGVRWWDYSGYFMNINGRICLQGAVVFGIGGCLIVYIFAPGLEMLYKKINANIKFTICVVLITLIVADQMYSINYPNMGEGVTASKRIETQIKHK